MAILQEKSNEDGRQEGIVLPFTENPPQNRSLIRVVIPTLNEAAALGGVLESVIAQDGPLEIVIVDAGSRDMTLNIAEAYGATVLHTSPCRGRQLALGAAMATTMTPDAFLFLHADTVLPVGAFEHLRKLLLDSEVVGGRFRAKFDSSHPLLEFASWMTRLPSSWVAFGDQGMFAKKSAFEAAGGFEEVPLFEDVGFYKRLGKQGKLGIVNDPVLTSGRRFQPRVLRQFLINAGLLAAHFAGMHPQKLAELYRRI